MAWNEPGKGQDPWGGRQPGGEGGPPDLDEIWRKFKERWGGNGGQSGGGSTGGGNLGSAGIVLILLAAVTVWLFSGFYTVDSAERGIVLQFGKYHDTTGPGLRWHVPYPIQKREIVNVDAVRSINDRAQMLTQDENIVDVAIAAQYKISSGEDFLFKTRDPEDTLRQGLRSAVREVVGKEGMDFLLTAGRDEVETRTRDLLQEMLDSYESGIKVTEINLQDAQPPEPVQDAFADAIRAREDEQRAKNEAEAYANDILPKARGLAAREVAEATAYKERVVAQAEGEATRFSLLREEYEQAPQVTRKRLYLDTMESVMGSASKVLVDTDGGNQMLYLPLDQIIRQSGKAAVPSQNSSPAPRSSQGGKTRSSGSNSSQRLRTRDRS